MTAAVSVIIALGVLIAGAGYFGFSQYEQVSRIVSEKAALEEERSQLSNEVEGLNESLTSVQTSLVQSHETVVELTEQNSKLEDQVLELTSERNALDYQYDKLKSEYNRLSDENSAIVQASYSQNYQIEQLLSQMSEQEQSDLMKQIKFLEQTEEVVFYRQFQTHNYKTGESYSVYWEVPFHAYFQYRIDTEGHVGAYVGSQETAEFLELSLATWRDMEKLADVLLEQARYDDEVYANIVLQVTHQLKYEPTENTKFPLESFAEGSGDCDTLAVFAAALMKAGGLDTAVLLGTAKGSPEDDEGVGHAMVGIALDVAPDDHYRDSPWYVDYGSTRYYLAEATWSDPFREFWDYDYIGTAVGDSPWAELSDMTVVETPG
jgi:hypothetical protein